MKTLNAHEWNLAQLERLLVLFLRGTAVLFMLLGLYQCLHILDLAGGAAFSALKGGQQTAIGYFAVVNLVAAVGLWLTSSWGTVLWLLAAVSDMLLHFFSPDVVATPAFVVLIHVGLILIYVWLVMMLERKRDL